MNKENENFIFLCLFLYFIPAGMAVLGALFELHKYYYYFLSMVMIMTDSGMLNIMNGPEKCWKLYMGSSIVTFIITILGFFSLQKKYSFSWELWIGLCLIFATAKIIQLIAKIIDNASEQ